MNLRHIWETTFDAIWCIHYLPYNDRLPHLKYELNRVGLLNAKNFKWKNTYDSSIRSKLYKQVENKLLLNEGVMNASISHYQCIKESYELGYERILILENDIAFNLDTELIEKLLTNVPKNADIILYDYLFGKDKEDLSRYKELRDANKRKLYIDFGNEKRVWMASCYSLNRNGMKHIIDSQEACMSAPDTYTYFRPEAMSCEPLNRYCSYVPMAIQKAYSSLTSSKYNVKTEDNVFYKRYTYMGVDINNYNIFENKYVSIDWKRYFDHIYCVHYIEYKDRFETIDSELERVGIKDSGIFSYKYTYDSPLYDVLYDSEKNGAMSKSYMKCGLAQYFCYKEAYELGYERILVLEDDIVFLKDISKIYEILENTPKDYDLVLYDSMTWDKKYYDDLCKKARIGNKRFVRYNEKMRLCSCYSMSRKMMEHRIDCEEKYMNTNDSYMSYNKDFTYKEPLKRCFSIDLIACQNPKYDKSINKDMVVEGKVNNLNSKHYENVINLDYSLYNIDNMPLNIENKIEMNTEIEYPIDFVFLYVDNTDKEWQKKYLIMSDKYGKKKNVSSQRYRDWGTLKWFLRGLDECMPWIRNTYMVVESESQVPAWIDREKIHIVYHKDIIPEQFLPTYNSDAIEIFLYRIEGLAEHFIYANDDMFAINKMNKDDFYNSIGNPYLKITSTEFDRNSAKVYRNILKTTDEFVRDDLGLTSYEDRVLHSDHSFQPMLKSTWEKLWEKHNDELESSISPFRENKNISQEATAFWHYLSGNYSLSERITKYVDFRKNTLKDIVECISSKKIQILCINDSGCNIFETAKSRINNSFKQKFPNMSKYEKVPEKKESPVMSTKDKVMNDLDIIKKRIQLQRARYEAMIQGNNFL